MVKEITIEKKSDGWWLFDDNNPEEYYKDVGPYTTKKEASEDRIGLKRTWRESMQRMRKENAKLRSGCKEVFIVSSDDEQIRPECSPDESDTGTAILRPLQQTFF